MVKTQLDRRSKRRQNPQKGYTQLLQGSRLATARAVNIDMHVKHCFEICRHVKNMRAGDAIAFRMKFSKLIQIELTFAEKQQQFHSDSEVETRRSDVAVRQWSGTEKEKLVQDAIQSKHHVQSLN